MCKGIQLLLNEVQHRRTIDFWPQCLTPILIIIEKGESTSSVLLSYLTISQQQGLHTTDITWHLNPNGVMISASDCDTARLAFNSGLSKGYSDFHHCGVDEMSTRIAWDFSTESSTQTEPPDRDICYIAFQG